jgi:hypothetical protein
MIIDGNLDYSDNQAITGAAASTKNKDHGNANAKIGDGTDLAIVIVVTEAFTFGTATEMVIELRDSANDSSYTVVLRTKGLAASDLTLGKRYVIKLPPGLQRYTQVYYNPDGTITAGKVDAFLASDLPTAE